MSTDDTGDTKSDGQSIDHTDPEALRQLYWGEGKSTIEIGKMAGVTHQTVTYHMDKHGIDRRTSTESRRVNRARFSTLPRGYERWTDWNGGDQLRVYVHRLLAVSEFGFGEVSGDEVHHKNGIKWDNRPGNIEILSTADHRREHIDVLNG